MACCYKRVKSLRPKSISCIANELQTVFSRQRELKVGIFLSGFWYAAALGIVGGEPQRPRIIPVSGVVWPEKTSFFVSPISTGVPGEQLRMYYFLKDWLSETREEGTGEEERNALPGL